MAENSPFVAMIHGADSTLGRAVALELFRRDVSLVITPADPRLTEELSKLPAADARIAVLDSMEHEPVPKDGSREKLLVQRAGEAFGRLDALINLCVPDSTTTRPFLREYPGRLLDRTMAACKLIAGATPRGSIVNHCFMPAMYAGTCLEQEIPMLKGAITGVTRILCRKFGPKGIRANTVQTGFIDMPETKTMASAEVLQLKSPVGRWGTPEEVAKFIAFLLLRNGYMTGQAVIMDGGLTAGMTGT